MVLDFAKMFKPQEHLNEIVDHRMENRPNLFDFRPQSSLHVIWVHIETTYIPKYQ